MLRRHTQHLCLVFCLSASFQICPHLDRWGSMERCHKGRAHKVARKLRFCLPLVWVDTGWIRPGKEGEGTSRLKGSNDIGGLNFTWKKRLAIRVHFKDVLEQAYDCLRSNYYIAWVMRCLHRCLQNICGIFLYILHSSFLTDSGPFYHSFKK